MHPTNGKLAFAVRQALVATFAISLAVPALAQVQRGEKIEVTGSNIKRIEGETALPVTVITRQASVVDIRARTATTRSRPIAIDFGCNVSR